MKARGYYVKSSQATESQRSCRKKWVLFVTLALGMPLILIGLIELSGRAYIVSKYGNPGKSYGIYTSDPVLGATHRPNSYNSNSVINNWGFRNLEDIDERKELGVTRVYCSGGSTTFCYNLTTEEAWPTILQDRLRRRPGHSKDEVINAGQICFPIASEMILAKRILPKLKPDVVVIFTAVNEVLASNIIGSSDGKDLEDLLKKKQWGVVPQHLDQARFLKRTSVIVRWIDYKLKKWLEPVMTRAYRAPKAKPKPVHPWVMWNFEHTLRAYINFLRESGVGRVIMVRWGDNGDENWHLAEIRRLRESGVKIAQEMGVEIFDFSVVAETHPQRKNLFIESGIHVTREGADLFAEKLAEFIAVESKRGLTP